MPRSFLLITSTPWLSALHWGFHQIPQYTETKTGRFNGGKFTLRDKYACAYDRKVVKSSYRTDG